MNPSSKRTVWTSSNSESGGDDGVPASGNIGTDHEKRHGDHQQDGLGDGDDEPVAAGSRHAGLQKRHPRTITMITEALKYLGKAYTSSLFDYTSREIALLGQLSRTII